MGGIKHKFVDYMGMTNGEVPADQEERLKYLLDLPTICKLCGKPIDKYSTSMTGHASLADEQRWAAEEKLEMHMNCYHDKIEAMRNGN